MRLNARSQMTAWICLWKWKKIIFLGKLSFPPPRHSTKFAVSTYLGGRQSEPRLQNERQPCLMVIISSFNRNENVAQCCRWFFGSLCCNNNIVIRIRWHPEFLQPMVQMLFLHRTAVILWRRDGVLSIVDSGKLIHVELNILCAINEKQG